MKKCSWFVIAMLVGISFIYAANLFDLMSFERVRSFYHVYDEVETKVSFNVEQPQTLMDSREFFQFLDDAVSRHHLRMFKMDYQFEDGADQASSTYYLSSNMEKASEMIVLDQGTYEYGRRYSTMGVKKEERISNFFGTYDVTILPLEERREIGGMYLIFNEDGDFEANLAGLTEEFQARYPQLRAVTQDYPAFAELTGFDAILGDLDQKGLVSFGLILFSCLILFTQRKKIGVYKAEGESGFQIYWYLFEKDFLISAAVGLVVILLASGLLFHASPLGLELLITLWTGEYLVLVLLTQLFSVLHWMMIDAFRLNNSLKGKNNLTELQWMISVVKVLAVVLLVSTAGSAWDSLGMVKDLLLHRESIVSGMENRYSVISQNTSLYFQDIVENHDQILQVYQDVTDQLNVYTFADSFMAVDGDWNNLVEIVEVDDLYLRSKGLTVDQDHAVLVFPQGVNENEEDILSLVRQQLAHYVYLDPEQLEVFHIDQELPSESYRTLLKGDTVSDALLFIPAEPAYRGQLVSLTFYDTEGLDSVQRKLDQIFIDHGYAPALNLGSCQSSALNTWNSNFLYHWAIVTPFVLISVIYFLVNSLLLIIDAVNHRKYYFITYCEGLSMGFFRHYFVHHLLPVCVGTILCWRQFNSGVPLTVLLCYELITAAVFIVLNQKRGGKI